MSLTLSAVIQVENEAARRALAETKTGVDNLGKATVDLAGKTKAGAGAATADAAAKRASAAASREMASANLTAAGSVGNIAAQFNDIGVMLAAGQNPLQLAIQQGSQISQVFGQAGAGGALQLLKEGFLSLISPVNLITIGVIAAGAAMFQWLTSAGEKAGSLEDQINDLTDAVSDWRDQSGKSFNDLRKEFGAITPEIVAMQRELLAIDIRRIAIEAAEASRSMREELGNVNVEDILGLKRVNAKQFFPQAGELRTLMEEAASAANPLDAANGWRRVSDTISAAVGGVGNMNLAQLDFYNSVLNTEAALRSAAVATGDVETSMDGAAGSGGDLNDVVSAIGASLASAAGVNLAGVFTGAFGAADTLLGKVGAILNGMVQAGALAAAQQRLNAAGKVYGGRGGDPRTSNQQGVGEFKYDGPALDQFNNVAVRASGSRSGGGGGGGGAAKAEADAVGGLIAKLQGEVESLRILDPLQKEMLQYRDQLAGATEAERAQVEQLIIVREREKAQLAQIEELQAFKESLVENALDALISKGESLQDVLKGVISSLAKAAIQAAIFGTGPLGSIFGGKGIGSLIFGGGKAAGGMVHGPGTGTSDSILTPLSNGEYIVNARATARNRHLLDAINSGASMGAGMAVGGPVGGRGPARTGLRDAPRDMRVTMDLRGARGDREIERAGYRGMKRALAEFERGELPRSVARISRDPTRIG